MKMNKKIDRKDLIKIGCGVIAGMGLAYAVYRFRTPILEEGQFMIKCKGKKYIGLYTQHEWDLVTRVVEDLVKAGEIRGY